MSRRTRIALRLGVVGAIAALLSAGAAYTVHSNHRVGVAAHLETSADMFVPGDDLGPEADGDGVPRAPGAARITPEGTVFGRDGGRHTLVLYDRDGPDPRRNELHGLAASMLASHFGLVTVQVTEDYRAGSLADYDALLYLGHDSAAGVPAELRTDITTSDTPVIWAGENVQELAGPQAQDQEAFRQRYGWDATRVVHNNVDLAGKIRYGEHVLDRDISHHNPQGMLAPQLTAGDRVTVVAEAPCGDVGRSEQCAHPEFTGTTSLPWAVRSANLTYVAEIPFGWVYENDRFLVYADLLYDALDPDVEQVRQAAVRLEDVNPTTDPAALRSNVDYLIGKNIPFSIAVIPRYLDPEGVANGGRPTSVTLKQSPELVAVLQHANAHGGTLVHHGTTHQFQDASNPYDGVSAADFEFYLTDCAEATDPNHALGRCDRDSVVANVGPIGGDSVRGWEARIHHGRDLFAEAGLPVPEIFETPHYVASTNAYHAMSLIYPTRYERVAYSTGLLTGDPPTTDLLNLHFPFRVTDPFGTTVLPENLGNFAPESFSGHAPRPVSYMVDNAKANLAVRESTASFFYHGYLPTEELAEIVTGIEELGYRFVPAQELR